MPKRKREDVDGDGAATGARQQRIQYKLSQSTVKLGHAFKVAKGFERQKLGRRQKNAAKEQDEKAGERIEKEIAALKTLETTAAAKHHLYKTLLKIKAVATSDTLGPEVASVPTLSNEAPVLNVVARLCNSNPVKEVLPDILEELQRAAGIPVEKSAAGKKKRLRAKDLEPAAGQNGKPEPAARRVAAKTEASESRHGEDSSDEEGGVQLETTGSEDDFADFDDRLADSDDSEDGEGSDVDDLERQLAAEGIARKSTSKERKPYNPADDLSLSEGSPSPSPSPEPQKAPKTKSSTYLPSLSMGGYVSGGSDSEPDSDIDVAPKKNRRGQRARQQIWEKKFGEKAKHVQNQKNDRSKGWDMKRGATEGGKTFGKGRGGKIGGRPGPSGRVGGGEGAAAPPPKKKHNDSEGPLHPSWAAAKAAKEKKIAPAKFEGKKITFD